ncbi:MAG TPA: FAD-dependent oxidoreductase [Acidimicrobiales bacterium]|jgi:NADPH-dependent 2,4-dienoyl-CoA reductase/sulfur reductase-like enzyme|nr:FAD-dependent oxidoreductase [Acidimicrobiales bacterium]
MAERLVVVGGDAGGMAAATQARRGRPDLEIVALEKGRWTSYSACGIPYVVGGEVAFDDLVVRSPEEHRRQSDIDVRVRHEAVGLDLDRREVEVRDHSSERTYRLGFDVLHLGLGARPLRPDLPGMDDAHVHGVQTLEDAADLLDDASKGSIKSVVVVGAGYIGLEIAEAFLHRGCPSVTVVSRTPEVMNTLDADMGALVSQAMRDEGIEVRCGTGVLGFDGRRVLTDNGGDVEADLVVLGLGVVPNSGLAGAAGLALGAKDALKVDLRQRTSAEGVWAAGDCCESFHLISRTGVHVALGTVANKQARVAGVNIGGGYATFPGVLGTAVTKLCNTEVARTGLSEDEARAAGFEFAAVRIESTTRAGYFPGAARIVVKLVVEKRSGRLLGGQIVGKEGAAKRIDVLAVALTMGMTVEEMTALDLSYAPPFSPVWDPVLVAARKAAETLA